MKTTAEWPYFCFLGVFERWQGRFGWCEAVGLPVCWLLSGWLCGLGRAEFKSSKIFGYFGSCQSIKKTCAQDSIKVQAALNALVKDWLNWWLL
jgi:hypothetical protein